jgi:hypothetical protein
MRRNSLSILALVMAACIMAGTAFSQSSGAHFQNRSLKASIDNPGNLTVSWVETGLGNLNIDYSLTADVAADYYCVSNSGSIPNAANKTTVNGSAEANGSFEPKNGKVSASLTLNIPAAPSSAPPTCGNGQTLRLQSIVWSNVLLDDTTNIVGYLFPGTFGRELFSLN